MVATMVFRGRGGQKAMAGSRRAERHTGPVVGYFSPFLSARLRAARLLYRVRQSRRDILDGGSPRVPGLPDAARGRGAPVQRGPLLLRRLLESP